MAQGKADAGKRIVAAIIDAIIAGVIGFILGLVLGWLPILGGLIAGLASAAFTAFRDALPISDLKGASPGKKLLGLKAVRGDGQDCDYETSLKRNSPFVAVGLASTLLAAIPILGWIALVLLIPVFLIVYIFELIKVLNDPKGIRWGDSFADTLVIETANAAGRSDAQAPPPPPAGAAPPTPEEPASSSPDAPPPPLPVEEPPAEENKSEPAAEEVKPEPAAPEEGSSAEQAKGQEDAFKPPEAPWDDKEKS